MIVRVIARIAIVLVGAAVVGGATYWAVLHVPALSAKSLGGGFLAYRRYIRRPLGPIPQAVGSFLGEFLVAAAIALAGRLILRLRL
jgi:hypothetical protein